jgi:isoleucyl-tRNA synthetase
MEAILALRALVNRQLEGCRSRGELGASLEARLQLELAPSPATQTLAAALQRLQASPHPRVDNLADWLLVSEAVIGGPPWPDVLAEASDSGLMLRIARAEGSKCERCWHHERDIGEHPAHPTLCGRCVGVLEPP